ncbi:MAG: RNA-binding domain-containing protein [Candidatus Nezhaarchaeales archaeon]
MGRVEVRAPLYPTEDEEKVRAAIQNILTPDEWRVVEEGGRQFLEASSNVITCLTKLRERLRRQRTLDAARYMMRRFSSANELTFYLHKQAAYVGYAVFCLPEGESPLGAIKVTVKASDIKRVLDWLAPPTEDGRPKFEVDAPEDP